MKNWALTGCCGHHTVNDVQCTDPSASALDANARHRLSVTHPLTIAEIARRLACSAPTVRCRLHASAIPVRPPEPNVARLRRHLCMVRRGRLDCRTDAE